MPNTRAFSGAQAPDDPVEKQIVELHWMKEPDLDMHTTYGISTPALCGTWIEPDAHLAGSITHGDSSVRFVSCKMCDSLHVLPDPPG